MSEDLLLTAIKVLLGAVLGGGVATIFGLRPLSVKVEAATVALAVLKESLDRIEDALGRRITILEERGFRS